MLGSVEHDLGLRALDTAQFGIQATAARVPVLHLASFSFTGATRF